MNKVSTHIDKSLDEKPKDLDRWLAFTFGVIFVSVLLYLATAVQNPSALTIKVYVTVLALAAAGVGAILPGFLEIKYKNVVRAGGALGLGVLVYLFEPAIGTHVPHFVEPTEPAAPVVKDFLSAIDSGDPARSWALMSATMRDHVGDSEAAWRDLYKNNRTPLGALQSRTLIGETKVESPPGYAPGIYRVFDYKTKYAADDGFRTEEVGVRANESGKWEIVSYRVSPTTFK